MRLHAQNADVFVPDATIQSVDALSRTTHLAIAAHQDDIEIMAYHGIAECYRSTDRWFTGVTVTDGAGSPRTGKFKDCSNEDMKNIRQDEQRSAAAIGGYSAQIQLGYESTHVKDLGFKQVEDDILAILIATVPEVVYLHNPADKHPTHVATCIHAVNALRRLPKDQRPKQVLGCEVWRSLDWLPEEYLVPLSCSAHPELARELLAVYDSQISGGKRYDLAVIGRRMANATFYESHSVDGEASISFAIDLTPLMTDTSLSLMDLVLSSIDRFHETIRRSLKG